MAARSNQEARAERDAELDALHERLTTAVSGLVAMSSTGWCPQKTNELGNLTANRDGLENEQTKLVQAHYADAIPLTVLKGEQSRILADLDQVKRRIDAHHGEYAEVRVHLDDALDLLANCADITPAATTPTGASATKPSSPASTSKKTTRGAARRTRPSLRLAS